MARIGAVQFSTVRLLATLPIALCGGLLASGCTIFLPAHPHSYATKGERIKLDLITYEDIKQKTYGEYTQYIVDAFPPEKQQGRENERFAVAAPLAMAAAGIAINVVSEQLRAEASKYEAQFASRRAASEFWIRCPDRTRDATPGSRLSDLKDDKECPWIWMETTETEQSSQEKTDQSGTTITKLTTKKTKQEAVVVRAQNYAGLLLRRYVEDPSSCEKPAVTRQSDKDADGCPVAAIAYAFVPSTDEQAFLLQPAYIKVSRSKAKVLQGAWWTWLVPTTLLGKPFGRPDGQLDIEITIRIEAGWRNKDGEWRDATLATATTRIDGYALADAPALCIREGCDGKPGGPAGWFGAPPQSWIHNKPLGDGTFTVNVSVVERDRTNARRYLEETATTLTSKKPEIVQGIGGWFK